MAEILDLTDDTFMETLQRAQLPVFVEFWAPWCGPCRAMQPALDQAARELDGEAIIAKLNTDLNPQTPKQFNVKAMPGLFLFHGTVPVAEKRGSRKAEALIAWIRERSPAP